MGFFFFFPLRFLSKVFISKEGKIPCMQGEGPGFYITVYRSIYAYEAEPAISSSSYSRAAEGKGSKQTTKVGGHFSSFNPKMFWL